MSYRLKSAPAYRRDVLPRLTAETVYDGICWTSQRGRYWHAQCPFHDDRDPKSRRFSVDTETLGYKCFSCGASGNALTWLADGSPVTAETFREAERLAGLTGFPPAVRRTSKPALRPKVRQAGKPKVSSPQSQRSHTDNARMMVKRSTPVPESARSAPRLWSGPDGAKPGVWPLKVPWPQTLRWLEEADGTGRLLAPLAPPDAWLSEAPVPHASTGVHTLAVGYDGSAIEDRGGLHKRSYGACAGCAWLCPGPPENPVGVAEGVADALAVRTLFERPCFALVGTAGFSNPKIAAALARIPQGVVIYPDGDAPGRKAARTLCQGILVRGGRASVWDPPWRDSDPAEVAEAALQTASGADPAEVVERLAIRWESRQGQQRP